MDRLKRFEENKLKKLSEAVKLKNDKEMVNNNNNNNNNTTYTNLTNL